MWLKSISSILNKYSKVKGLSYLIKTLIAILANLFCWSKVKEWEKLGFHFNIFKLFKLKVEYILIIIISFSCQMFLAVL